jgi:hypothetical protein
VLKNPADAVPAALSIVYDPVCVGREREDVGDGLQNNNPSKPAMEEVEGVVADVEYRYERVVAECAKNRQDEIESCKRPASSTQLSHPSESILAADCSAIENVAEYVAGNEKVLRLGYKGPRARSVQCRQIMADRGCPCWCIRSASLKPLPIPISYVKTVISWASNDRDSTPLVTETNGKAMNECKQRRY